jgi:hypothetical protein
MMSDNDSTYEGQFIRAELPSAEEEYFAYLEWKKNQDDKIETEKRGVIVIEM